MLRLLVFAMLLSTVAIAAETPPEQTHTAVRIYTGPTFWTGDPGLPEAVAIAVDRDNRVLELYGEVPEDTPWEIIHLPGALALPGLHDAHLHVSGIGKLREQVLLNDATSMADAAARTQAWADDHPDAQIIRGRGWDQSRWPGGEFPTWRDLNGVSERPVYLRRVDGHAAWLNRAMLDLAGITRNTPDPDGGRILRDADGEPTGIIVDNAIDLLDNVLPKPTLKERERWLLAGLNACADAGLVAVHDMGQSPITAAISQDLADKDRLPIRFFVYLEGTHDRTLEVLGTHRATDRFRVMGVKYYADGALGSRGALLLDDYSDEPGHRGLAVTSGRELSAGVAEVHRRGFQCAIHAIGDAGNRMALDAIAFAQRGEVDPQRRHRVEHAQVVHPDDFARFVSLGALASMQPTHCTSDMRWAEDRVGAERVKGAYAWRTFRELDVPIPFGSDAPVEDWNPLPGLYAAITRQDADGQPTGGWYPEQRLSWHEAVAAFTHAAAYAVGREADLGRLSVGYIFDCTVLAADPRDDVRGCLDTHVAAVFVGGRRIR